MEKIDVSKLSAAERQSLLGQLQHAEKEKRRAEREAYEGLRHGFVQGIKGLVLDLHGSVTQFSAHLVSEADGFRQVMEEHGAVKMGQLGFAVVDGNFKVECKAARVKRFDERADMAAARLVKYLKDWVKTSDKGTDDPMYQLAMLAIERNQKGDLDYKQVSNLYKLEGKFDDPEYSAIMELFRESHIIEGTATHFYFYQRTELGVWKKIEISFNRF